MKQETINKVFNLREKMYKLMSVIILFDNNNYFVYSQFSHLLDSIIETETINIDTNNYIDLLPFFRGYVLNHSESYDFITINTTLDLHSIYIYDDNKKDYCINSIIDYFVKVENIEEKYNIALYIRNKDLKQKQREITSQKMYNLKKKYDNDNYLKSLKMY